MSQDAIGLDIGGANLKAATASGRALAIPFELWRHPDRLADELAGVRRQLPDPSSVGVTMTGELCDCFPTKRDGVRHILDAVETAFPGRAVGVWSTTGRFVPVVQAVENHVSVAAANWHALATLVGRWLAEGPALLLDTGSTTTDVIPILNGLPVPTGRDDPSRLGSGELVYTGVRRTPVCAVLGPAVAAEWFATTNDVYVRLKMLPSEPDNRSTADGRPMTDEHAHARLSRMLGGDPEITPCDETLNLARRVLAAQSRAIADGIRKVVARLPARPVSVCLSGSGEFLARAAWEEMIADGGVNPTAVGLLSSRLGRSLSESACAYAVAVLMSEASWWA